jgi:7,8-dihydropterin-6-yl-methyl-4-(beta-D-ribofuranosyl)aminobenzene 5'-phosphate synthase
MNITTTTLSENTASLDFMAEWGLSMLIEADGKRILLDTGAGLSSIYNAQLLSIDFSIMDSIVLSHGHHDHTGGLKGILERRNEGIDVIAHPAIWDAKYSLIENKKKYIGIPFKREHLETLGANFILSRGPVWLTENIVTSGEVPFVTTYEGPDQSLYKTVGNNLIPDDFQDDLSLAIKTEKGLAIFLGCAHRGMINTIKQLQRITGDQRIYSVVGGTHLISASEERLEKTIGELKKTGLQKLGVSHCTGFNASARLANEFKDIFFLNSSGSSHRLL